MRADVLMVLPIIEVLLLMKWMKCMIFKFLEIIKFIINSHWQIQYGLLMEVTAVQSSDFRTSTT